MVIEVHPVHVDHNENTGSTLSEASNHARTEGLAHSSAPPSSSGKADDVTPCDKIYLGELSLPPRLPTGRDDLISLGQEFLSKVPKLEKANITATASAAILVLALWQTFKTRGDLMDWLNGMQGQLHRLSRNNGQRIARALATQKIEKDCREFLSRVGQVASAAHYLGIAPAAVPEWLDRIGIRGARNLYNEHRVAIEGPDFKPQTR